MGRPSRLALASSRKRIRSVAMRPGRMIFAVIPSRATSLAREVARDGITANIILPGRIATDRIRFLDEAKAKREGRPIEAVTAESTSSIPIGRYGKPEEYAHAVAFLASNRASYITGSVIRVDGGLIASI